MKVKVLLIFLIICVFSSCSSEKKKAAPIVLLSEQQMVDVLTDVEIMEGIIAYKKNANQKIAYLKNIGYDTLFAHYGITDSIFEENLMYYNEMHPYTLERVMDSVVSRLAKMKNQ